MIAKAAWEKTLASVFVQREYKDYSLCRIIVLFRIEHCPSHHEPMNKCEPKTKSSWIAREIIVAMYMWNYSCILETPIRRMACTERVLDTRIWHNDSQSCVGKKTLASVFVQREYKDYSLCRIIVLFRIEHCPSHHEPTNKCEPKTKQSWIAREMIAMLRLLLVV